jgi:hypothetical protein
MRYRWTLLSLAAVTVATLGFIGSAAGDSDEQERHEQHEHEHEHGSSWWSKKTGVPPVMNDTYQQECASCHTAYSPGLLPARSWQKLMAGLDDHFGDNAELMPEQHQAVLQYLVENAADGGQYRVSAKILRTIGPDEAPLRITETRYFVAKHDEVPSRLVEKNPDVGSFSNCSACHKGAEKGYFNEHDVRIPGYGRFED